MKNLVSIIFILNSLIVTGQSNDKLMQEKMKALDEYLEYAVVNSDFSGQVLVSSEHKKWIDKGYGYADRAKKVKINEGTIFDIGDLSAQFTVAAILYLEQEGKLSVIDNISKFFDVPKDKSGITLHHLITHTSGFKESLGGEFDLVTRMQMIKQAMESELLFTPGVRYSKSYIDYALLAAIIEIVSGKSFEDYLHENLFDKASMDQTGFLLPKFSEKSIAIGYTGPYKWGRTSDHMFGTNGASWYIKGSAGFLSNATDLYKWYDAVLSDEILWQENVFRLFLPQVDIDAEGKHKFCYGWITAHSEIGGASVISEGNNKVFAGRLQIYLDSGVVIVLLTNAYNEKYEEIYEFIEQHAFN